MSAPSSIAMRCPPSVERESVRWFLLTLLLGAFFGLVFAGLVDSFGWWAAPAFIFNAAATPAAALAMVLRWS